MPKLKVFPRDLCILLVTFLVVLVLFIGSDSGSANTVSLLAPRGGSWRGHIAGGAPVEDEMGQLRQEAQRLWDMGVVHGNYTAAQVAITRWIHGHPSRAKAVLEIVGPDLAHSDILRSLSAHFLVSHILENHESVVKDGFRFFSSHLKNPDRMIRLSILYLLRDLRLKWPGFSGQARELLKQNILQESDEYVRRKMDLILKALDYLEPVDSVLAHQRIADSVPELLNSDSLIRDEHGLKIQYVIKSNRTIARVAIRAIISLLISEEEEPYDNWYDDTVTLIARILDIAPHLTRETVQLLLDSPFAQRGRSSLEELILMLLSSGHIQFVYDPQLPPPPPLSLEETLIKLSDPSQEIQDQATRRLVQLLKEPANRTLVMQHYKEYKEKGAEETIEFCRTLIFALGTVQGDNEVLVFLRHESNDFQQAASIVDEAIKALGYLGDKGSLEVLDNIINQIDRILAQGKLSEEQQKRLKKIRLSAQRAKRLIEMSQKASVGRTRTEIMNGSGGSSSPTILFRPTLSELDALTGPWRNDNAAPATENSSSSNRSDEESRILQAI